MGIVFGIVRGAIASSNAPRVRVQHAAGGACYSILEEKVSLVLPMMYRRVGGHGTILVRFVFQQMDNVFQQMDNVPKQCVHGDRCCVLQLCFCVLIFLWEDTWSVLVYVTDND